jgi:aspartyl-tRNA(Asn)/glutamyl-tRNA(Gln) amidotransferase subunit A
MIDDTLDYLTITALSERIQSGELSPVTLTGALLDRIKALNPKLNAFRLITEQRAMAAAEAAEKQIRNGQSLGPLHGIPYATKDLYDVQGLPTTAGSNTLSDNIAAEDATVTRKLAQAGMILLGKTNTVEFAFGSVGINHSHGTPHNPWQQEPHVPGGSSSGSAVGVAAGLMPMGTGSDTACSVRGPAALCGVVGLKTTVGRISRHGVFPLSWTLDSIGPLTRSVADAALIQTALQGKDPHDPATMTVEPVDVLGGLHDGVKGLRIAFPESAMFKELDPEVEQAVRACGQIFKDLGAWVDSIDYPEADAALALPASPSMVEGCMLNAERLDKQFDAMDPVVAERMILGRNIPAVTYAQTLYDMQRLRASSQHTLRNIDALLVPTCMVAARPVSEADASLDSYMQHARIYMRNCFVGNLLDLCAVTVPCGLTAKGLPIGLMIYAKPFCEDMALRVAQAFERATEWHRQRPDLSWAN